MYDTIIIGAGMSGLAAGIRLAHYERRVCILERHSAVGGLNSFYGRRGRIFDVGLHAITNYAPKGVRGPLSRLLRQLRWAWEELSLAPQIGSAIMFPGVTLEFSNDFALFESEIARQFPRQTDNFHRLTKALADYDDFRRPEAGSSARDVVAGYIDDPLLVEMLLCPVLFYGGAREHDMDFGQFSILFRSIFLEGLARPLAGIRLILKRLLRSFLDLGGELRLRSGVDRILLRDGRVDKVVLDDGVELEAANILSSAGWRETMRLCGGGVAERPAGGLSVVESISLLNAQPRELGYDRTIVFFNDSDKFHYQRPAEAADVRSGIVCSPNNFVYPEPPSDGMMRISVLGNYDRWAELPPDEYQQAKRLWYDRMAASAVRFIPDFRGAVVETDVFTPTTIRRFTGHENGSIYGTADKRYDGTTPFKNLYLCGNDQGLVGIIGTILSGISIANRYLLKA